uniref:26S proteasome non-ATPase regulatory subunit 1 (Trinotate prediction) n=1 Tax=Henneguya salminicola TaxID=69463 RepID=A0A6G3MEK2_HENSL
MVAMSYAGSNDPYAVKTLWRLAASDSHDDVKRASMIALSLVMFREPEQFLAIALLFVQSYNAFLRAGAILSLGIVFTGSGNDKVINLIRAALLDSSLIVRQSAYMSCSMLLIQTNEKNIENYTEFKNMLSGMCTDKHSDNIAKFGAYIGFGIMDVGCRNQAMTFQTLQGHTRIQSIIGILIFQQFWYWFPFVHFLSLCFVPTSIILINPNLEMPQIKFNCDADLNLFSYPIFKQTKPKDTQEKFRVAQLCQTNKSRGKRRNFKDCDPNHITKSLSLRKSRNAHFSQIVLHNEEGKVLSHKSSSHRGILTNKQQHNPPTPISSESATTTESVPTPCPTATATSTSTTDTISVSTPVQTDNKAVETQTQLHSKKTKNEKSLLPLSETKSKSEEQTEENTKDTTITDAVHNLMNPVRALPRQLKYMSIDPSSLPLQTVKAVSCGGIIVCYTENEVDESKLNNISKSDKKPNEEDAPTLEPSENYTTPATATTGLK